MNLIVAPDSAAWASRAADVFSAAAIDTIKKKGRFVVALSGGRSPESMFNVLAEQQSQLLPWNKVHLFWVDERCVSPGDPGSNYGMTRRSLLSKVSIPEEQVYRIQGELPPLVSAERYEQRMKKFFGPSDLWPNFDLIVLGLGEDGHTASLFPGLPALEEQKRWACAVHVSRQPVYKDRVTLTFPVINNATHQFFLCQGVTKAAILKRVLIDQDISLPATHVKSKEGNMTWLLDHAAAGMVSQLKASR